MVVERVERFSGHDKPALGDVLQGVVFGQSGHPSSTLHTLSRTSASHLGHSNQPLARGAELGGATAMQMHDGGACFGEYCKAVFQAVWVDGLDMGDAAVVAQVLGLAGELAAKDRLKAVTEEAVARGVFGAPTMFWGQDRVDFVREALAA